MSKFRDGLGVIGAEYVSRTVRIRCVERTVASLLQPGTYPRQFEVPGPVEAAVHRGERIGQLGRPLSPWEVPHGKYRYQVQNWYPNRQILRC